MKIPDAKAGDKEWDKLKNLRTWQESKVKSKQDVIEQTQKEGKTVHFAKLIDLCHLQNRNWRRSSNNTKAVLCYVATL